MTRSTQRISTVTMDISVRSQFPMEQLFYREMDRKSLKPRHLTLIWSAQIFTALPRQSGHFDKTKTPRRQLPDAARGFSLKTQRNATALLSGRAGARLRDRKGFPPQLRASSAAFCRSVMSMVHRAFRSASPPESPAISVRVLPLRASQKPSLCSYHSLPSADAPRIP